MTRPDELDRLANAYRSLRAPGTLAPALRAAAEQRLSRRRFGAWWAAAAAAGAIVIAVGLQAPDPTEPAARIATGLPSLSQLRSRVPPRAPGDYRMPSLGSGMNIPTLPSTPRRERPEAEDASDADDAREEEART